MYEYEYEAMHGLENVYWWFVARRILAEELIADEIGGRSSIRILDIGCGTGANMEAFAQQGTTVGIDFSLDALRLCQSRGLQTLALTGVERLPFGDRSFDIVTALDILEHTDDDLKALEEIHRIM